METGGKRFSCGALLILPGTKEFEIAESRGLANADMCFSKDYPYFTLPPLDEDKTRLREIFDWVDSHNGTDFWDYGVAKREAVLKLLPDVGEAHMDLGVAYFKAGNFKKAEEHIRLAMDMEYPLPGVGYTYLACIAVERRDFKKAVSALGKAKKQGDPWADENLHVMHQWVVSGGQKSGKSPRLVPNRDFMSLVPLAPHWLKQPFMPGPIIVPKSSGPQEIAPRPVRLGIASGKVPCRDSTCPPQG